MYLGEKYAPRGGAGRQVSSCSAFFGQAGYKGHKNEGVGYSLGRKGLGIIFPDFHSSPAFLKRERIWHTNERVEYSLAKDGFGGQIPNLLSSSTFLKEGEIFVPT